MSYEKHTPIEPTLPEGDVTVLVRVANLANLPYDSQHASYLEENMLLDMALVPNNTAIDTPQITAIDGELYAKISTHGINCSEAVARSAKFLYKGLAHVAFETAEIFGSADEADKINPNKSLDESFPHLQEDVTIELRHELEELKFRPTDSTDFDAELYAMLDA
jgi:hypothetical protein